MSLITSLLDGLAALTEPYWLTLYALGEMISDAGAGTALVGAFLLILSLDMLRASKGMFVPLARVTAVASTVFLLASFVYGDFMAAPAKAAYSALIARAEAVSAHVVALTTLGAASASVFLLAARRPEMPAAQPKAQHHLFASARRKGGVEALGASTTLNAAERLKLRQMGRNQKKSVNAVRSALRSMPGAPVTRTGRRVAHFERV